MARMPPSTATLLLGRALVGVGIAVGVILYIVPLAGPRWPTLVLGGAVAIWGAVAWWMAAAGRAQAAPLLAGGIAFTAWSYYLLAPHIGTQLTGITLLLPVLACLPILAPRGVAAVGLGSIGVNVLGLFVHPEGAVAPLHLASLTAATALGWVVAMLQRGYVEEVAVAKAHERELSLLRQVDEQRADFLRRFINAASHEIATPLTPMILSLAGGRTPSLPALDRIRRSADRLQHIALGLGEVAALEAAPQPLVRDLDLHPAVARAMASAGVSWPLAGSGCAVTSQDLLDQALRELADNQRRHAPEVSVEVFLEDRKVTVLQDPAQMPEGAVLGAPFERHHESSQGGLGLYALARRMVRQGGTLEALVEDGRLVHRFHFRD